MATGFAMYHQVEQQNTSLDALLYQHASLVKRIAHHLLGRLPASVQLDDLVQAGMIGLLEAVKNYDDSKGASFETYAAIRIRGMMLDEVRRNDWVPRSVHRNARMITERVSQLEHRLGRPASDREIADALQISIEDYHQMLLDSSGAQLFALDEMLHGGDELTVDVPSTSATQDPLDDVLWSNFRHKLVESIEQLPDRERLVLSLYYDEELNLKEIGSALGVSESRVCQLHTQAMMRLQGRVKDWRA
jgi:RNA polymerase sigma factor for flagellar operon FliA